jgi:methylated-DNA-[protein]-cysteine S-methyltransferase
MNASTDFVAFASDADMLARLRHRLELAAEAEGLLEVAYTIADSPVGMLLLAATPAGWSG